MYIETNLRKFYKITFAFLEELFIIISVQILNCNTPFIFIIIG